MPASVRLMSPAPEGEARFVAEAAHVKREPREDTRLRAVRSIVVAEAIATARRVHEQVIGHQIGIKNDAGRVGKPPPVIAATEGNWRKQHAAVCEFVVPIPVDEDIAGRSPDVPGGNPNPYALDRRPLAGKPQKAAVPVNPCAR